MRTFKIPNEKLNALKSYASRIKRIAAEIKVLGKCPEEKADIIFELSEQIEHFLIQEI